MPRGRPSKYDPDFCDRIIELGETGASVVEMAYEIGVHKDTLYQWASEKDDFSAAFTRAKMASQVWWERKGQSNLDEKGFNSSVWSRSMAARFPDDWRESKDINNTHKFDDEQVAEWLGQS